MTDAFLECLRLNLLGGCVRAGSFVELGSGDEKSSASISSQGFCSVVASHPISYNGLRLCRVHANRPIKYELWYWFAISRRAASISNTSWNFCDSSYSFKISPCMLLIIMPWPAQTTTRRNHSTGFFSEPWFSLSLIFSISLITFLSDGSEFKM